MSSTVLLLDSNILLQRRYRELLAEQVRANRIQVYIPMLVHAEIIRRMANEYGERYSIEVIRQVILDAQFELRPMSVDQAEAVADVWLALQNRGKDSAYWRAHRFDIVICAVAHATEYKLVTDDTGVHFRLVSDRIKSNELEIWLQSLDQ